MADGVRTLSMPAAEILRLWKVAAGWAQAAALPRMGTVLQERYAGQLGDIDAPVCRKPVRLPNSPRRCLQPAWGWMQPWQCPCICATRWR